jgi:hypothetical protein
MTDGEAPHEAAAGVALQSDRADRAFRGDLSKIRRIGAPLVGIAAAEIPHAKASQISAVQLQDAALEPYHHVQMRYRNLGANLVITASWRDN